MLRRLTLQKGTTPKFVIILVKNSILLSFIAYIGAFAYIYYATDPSSMENTRVSENAFLPGIVTERFDKQTSLSEFSKNLRKAFKDKDQKNFVMNTMNRFGLEVYNQSFSLNTPYLKESGENIYGILRAEKMPPVESMLLVVPFDEEHLMSAVLALTMADYFKNQVYWARDIIFLFAHPSAIGVEAWLAAFHGHEIPNLYANPLDGRSGTIVGVFIFDYIGQHFTSANLKFYGVNGRQPNLDLVNIVARISRKSAFASVVNGIYPQEFLRNPTQHAELFHSFIESVFDQTFVEINGLNSVFGSYGISAVTIEGNNPASNRNRATDIQDMAVFVEACFRSLNNVLEKLHQSYFLYYLLSPDKFMSVAYYMPIAGFFIAAMVFCALREYFCITNFTIPKAFILNHLFALGFYFGTIFLFSSHLLEDSLILQASVLVGGPFILYFLTFFYSIDSASECFITRFVFFIEIGLLIGATSLISISPGIVIGVVSVLPILLITQIIPTGKVITSILAFFTHPLILLFAGQFALAHLEFSSYSDLKKEINPLHTAFNWSFQGLLGCLHKHLIHSSMLFPLYSIFLLAASSNLASIARFPKVLLHEPSFPDLEENKLKTE
uniref:GPI transamidase component GAA1 n=1 Tax=Panagrolaimus sp. ES5 TaxID=591445 RepID=A0AC34FBV3_9BILA